MPDLDFVAVKDIASVIVERTHYITGRADNLISVVAGEIPGLCGRVVAFPTVYNCSVCSISGIIIHGIIAVDTADYCVRTVRQQSPLCLGSYTAQYYGYEKQDAMICHNDSSDYCRIYST